MEKYYKIICSNGYCGCDEEFVECCDPDEIDDIAEEILNQEYSFCEPDPRFVDDWDDEDAIQDYYDGLSCDIVEITKADYDEYPCRY